MPGQRRAIRVQMPAHWTRGVRRPVVLAALGALAVLAAATTAGFVFLGGAGPQQPHRALSTTLASQQLAGLAAPGPAPSAAQRPLTPSATRPPFLAGGGHGSGLARQH